MYDQKTIDHTIKRPLLKSHTNESRHHIDHWNRANI